MTRDEFFANFEVFADSPGGVQRLREMILELAVRGELVRDDSNLQPAKHLLQKIATKRYELTKNGSIRATDALLEIQDAELPFVASPSWSWARFGDLAQIVGGVTLGRNLSGKKTAYFPYVRVANVQRNRLDLKTIKEVAIPVTELPKYRLERDDILLTEGGDWDKVGRAAIWDGEIEYCLHQNHIFRARPFLPDLRSRWITLYVNSPGAQRYFQQAAKQTTNLASINMTQLRNCPIPLPSSQTQDRIIAMVDQLMSLCDDLEVTLKRTVADSQRLSAAALHALFT